ncbi:MAG: DUF2141 domain-containing protein [Bacteroidota bacterium]
MKSIISFFCFVAISCTTLLAQNSGTLQLSVTNVKATEGKIMIAVFDKEANFLTSNRFKSVAVPADKKGTIEVEIAGLPFGEYGISIFHDENDNNELDSNFMGIPKEPYGFSNNASGTFGPPSYKKAAFSFAKDQQTHSIKVN